MSAGVFIAPSYSEKFVAPEDNDSEKLVAPEDSDSEKHAAQEDSDNEKLVAPEDSNTSVEQCDISFDEAPGDNSTSVVQEESDMPAEQGDNSIPDVAAIYLEEAIDILEEAGIRVIDVIKTLPPRMRGEECIKKDRFRVVSVISQGSGNVSLVVTRAVDVELLF